MRSWNKLILAKCLLLAAGVTSGCVAPKFLIDIPANSTPGREARYYRTHDAANFTAGFVADEALRQFVFTGPTDHYGAGVRQLADTTIDGLGHRVVTWTTRTENYTFRTGRTGMDAPYARMAVVAVAAVAVRQTDRGYRESGVLFNLLGAFVNEWLHFFVAGVRGHF